MSHLVNQGIVDCISYSQEKVFEAGKIFLQTEGILPAPESAHAVAAVIDEALKMKDFKEAKVILFNLSGHGFLDISAYDKSPIH